MVGKNLFKWKDSKVYLIIIGCLIAIIAFYQPILALLLAIALIYLIYHYIVTIRDKEKEWAKYIEGLQEEFDSITKHAIFNMPFPLVILDQDGIISWYNTRFLDMMDEEDILNEHIDDFIPGLKVENILNNPVGNPLEIKYKNEYYGVYYNIVENKKSISTKDRVIVLYWVNKTDFMDLAEKYEDEKMAVCIAYVDNYDEVKGTTTEANRPLVLAEIDKIISAYGTMYNGIVRKYENDKYILIFEEKHLKQIESRKFDILDQIREIDKGNTISVTLSMGVGVNGKNPNETMNMPGQLLTCPR